MKRKWQKRDKKVVRVANQLRLSEAEKLKEQRIIEYILKVVEKYLHVDSDFVTTKNRKRELVFARQVSMYLIFRYSTCSLERIGEVFNGKDHATVLHGKRTIANLMDTDKEVLRQINELERVIDLNIGIVRENIDLSKDFYYINFNDHISIQFGDKKGMILTGFSDEEIEKIKTLFYPFIESRLHKNTGFYILEKQHENTN